MDERYLPKTFDAMWLALRRAWAHIESYKRFPPLDPRVSPEEWRKTLGRFDAVMYADRVTRLQTLYPVQIEAQP